MDVFQSLFRLLPGLNLDFSLLSLFGNDVFLFVFFSSAEVADAVEDSAVVVSLSSESCCNDFFMYQEDETSVGLFRSLSLFPSPVLAFSL